MSKPAPSCAVRSFTLAAIMLSAGAAVASAQQILEIHGNSLTTTIGGASAVQMVQPRHFHRGVNVDGSLREPSTQGWACAGNPFGDGAGWSGHNRLGDMRLDTGTYNPLDIDLALPSAGVQWIIGRTLNGQQVLRGSRYRHGHRDQLVQQRRELPGGRDYHRLRQRRETVHVHVRGAWRHL